LKKAVGIICLAAIFMLNIFGQENQENIVPLTSAAKYNKRGYYGNEDVKKRANVLISDYDGNIMVQYSDYLDALADLGGDITTTYNLNVEHRVFQWFNYPRSEAINHPEWIIGFKGFALQTLNFSTYFFLDDRMYRGQAIPPLTGNEVPLIIPGYHICNDMVTFYNTVHWDEISILRADGSKMILQNTDNSGPYREIGLYKEMGSNYGFAYVEYIDNYKNLRRIYYYPGDGLRYVFEEEKLQCPDYFQGVNIKTIYLKKIDNLKLNMSLEFNYSDLWGHLTYGRKVISEINFLINDVAMYKCYQFGDLVDGSITELSMNNCLTKQKMVLKLIPFSESVNSTYRDRDCSQIYSIESVTDNLGRTDKFTYTKQKRLFGYHEVLDRIEYEYKSLLQSIDYYNGKRTEFSYFDKNFPTTKNAEEILWFTENPMLPCEHHSPNYLVNGRDCFTNFMLKECKTFNRNNGINSQLELVKTEKYDYLWGAGTPPFLSELTDEEIKLPCIDTYSKRTSITTIDHISGTLKSSTNMKTYDVFLTENLDKNGGIIGSLDYGKVIKLVSESISEPFDDSELKLGSTNKSLEIIYTYDAINTEGKYKGTFNPTSVTEKYKSNLNEIIKNRYTNYTYATIKLGYIQEERKIILSKKDIDEKGKEKITFFKNYIPNYNSSNTILLTKDNIKPYSAFYKIELPEESKVLKGNLIENWEKNYFDDKGFVTRTETNLTAGKNEKTYTYNALGLLEKSIINNRIFKDIKYPASTFAIPYQEAIPLSTLCKLAKPNKTENNITVKHNGHYFMPYETKLSTSDGKSYSSYTSFGWDGNLQYEIDPQGYYYEYDYDEIGRVKSVSLPGSFINGVAKYDVSNFISSNLFSWDVNNRQINQSKIAVNSFYSKMGVFEKGVYEKDIKVTTKNNQDFYFFSSEGISLNGYSDSQINRSPLLLKLKFSQVVSSFGGKEIIIGAINRAFNKNELPYVSNAKISINLESLNVGNDYSLAIDISSILKQIRNNNDKLYGFVVAVNRGDVLITNIGNGMQISEATSRIEFKGYPRIIFDKFNETMPSSGYKIISDIENGQNTVAYDYYDTENKVAIKNILNNDPSALKIIETQNQYDALGQLLTTSRKNSAGALELKSKVGYSFRGESVSGEDGEGRKTKTEYDYLGRPVKIKYQDANGLFTIYKTINYKIVNGQEVTETIDEEGKKTETYYDLVGNVVKEVKGGTLTTLFTYDDIYRLTKVTSPAGKETKYTYDALNNIQTKETPDDGKFEYAYDKYGNLRYTFHKTASPKQVLFNSYDCLNRLVTSGIVSTSVSTIINSTSFRTDVAETFENDDTTKVLVNMYDSITKTGVFSNLKFPHTSKLRNQLGRLAATAFRDKPTDPWKFKIYSYDHLGRVEKEYIAN